MVCGIEIEAPKYSILIQETSSHLPSCNTSIAVASPFAVWTKNNIFINI